MQKKPFKSQFPRAGGSVLLPSALLLAASLSACRYEHTPLKETPDPALPQTIGELDAQVQGTRHTPLPQITELASWATIPREVFRKYDSRLIGVSLVARFRAADLANPEEPATIDYRKDTEIQLVFPHKYIESIARDGFKNQHQTGKSGGDLNPPARAVHEDHLARLHLEKGYDPRPDNPVHELRPKYAFVSFKKPVPGDKQFRINCYGDVVAVLKEEIKDRSTMTMGDSLNLFLAYYSTEAGKGIDPKPRSFDLKSRAPLRFTRGPHYVEAQIWGALGFEDVDHFLVDCPRFGKIPSEALDRLKTLGIPVFRCTEKEPPVKTNGTWLGNAMWFESGALDAGERL